MSRPAPDGLVSNSHDSEGARARRFEVLSQPFRIVPDYAARCVTNACQAGRKACPTPLACSDYALRNPEAAHAASELDDDAPGERMVRAIGWVMVAWLVAALCLVAVAAFGASL